MSVKEIPAEEKERSATASQSHGPGRGRGEALKVPSPGFFNPTPDGMAICNLDGTMWAFGTADPAPPQSTITSAGVLAADGTVTQGNLFTIDQAATWVQVPLWVRNFNPAPNWACLCAGFDGTQPTTFSITVRVGNPGGIPQVVTTENVAFQCTAPPPGGITVRLTDNCQS
jgi:hypothetical protein